MSLLNKPQGKHAHGSKQNNITAAEDVADESAVAVEGAGDADGGAVSDAAESDGAVQDDGGSVASPADDNDEGDSAKGGDDDSDMASASADGSDGGAMPAASAEETAPTSGEAGFVAAGFREIPSVRRRRGLKVFGIIVGVIAAIVLIAYLVGVVVFMGRFLPNTTIGEYDVSMKTDDEVIELLDGIVAGYQLDVVGGGFAYRTTGEGIGLAIDSTGIVGSMHEHESAWQWPVLILQSGHDETGEFAITFKESVYKDDVIAAVNTFNEGAKPPVNATITYDEKDDKFIVLPEEIGTQLDAQAVLDSMAETIGELDRKLVLDEGHLLQPTVRSDDEKLIEAAELATGMVSASVSLVMDAQPVGEVNGETLSQFITINDDFEVVFREEEMDAWVEGLASGLNTVGTERSYTRADGKQITVPAGGSYGWEVDTEALKNAVLEGIKSGKVSEVEVPCIDTAAVYNGVGQRDWGNRYIDVDITEQHVRFYGDDGAIIWEADCISGMPDGTHDTVPGTWYINAKESPSKLIGYENGKKIYETSVTYWMPFEGNSIGFHDATWQPGFGGSMYANGYGSHGCVNLSSSDAKSLYGIVEGGDVVVVHY